MCIAAHFYSQVACGPSARAVCALLAHGGVACRQVDRETYERLLVTKLLWASVFWLLSAALGGATAGKIATANVAEVKELVGELLLLAAAYLEGRRLRSGCFVLDLGTGMAQAEWKQEARSISGTGDRIGSKTSADDICGAVTPSSIATASDGRMSVDEVMRQLCEYSLAIAAAVPSKAMALKEFRWRNGFFLQQGETAAHVAWLERAGVPWQDLLHGNNY